MSKKKGKPAARKAPKKALKKLAAARGVVRRAATSLGGVEHTAQVTIFLFRTSSGNKIRTAPQRAYAGPGTIEWTVVNMIDGSEAPVRITWIDAPFKSLEFKGRHSEPIPEGVRGVFKYVVHAFDTQEDPEVEIPGN